MTDIIKHNVRYVPCRGNDTIEDSVYFIYSRQNKYLGHITYLSNQLIIFNEYKSGVKFVNVYPWPTIIKR